MFSSIRRFHHSSLSRNVSKVQLTLFSKQSCGLCDTAKSVLEQVMQKPNYKACKYKVVDILKPDNKEWFDKYCFDVPVLHVHNVENASAEEVGKLFHRLDEKKVQDLVEKFK
ncbi:unnamed protein product [Kluyveromyces dobzhanskii CBS 2104]|uniref:Glutaredoxin-like protein n=1 Tax=Kluyveromyces dobzhanskii CBS 2104 TaxID=1427455 RepID=A0A0A8L2E7_9SACH|nr:unnamed protein product [Kluyveromyces dobzhanskii CBS 2104]